MPYFEAPLPSGKHRTRSPSQASFRGRGRDASSGFISGIRLVQTYLEEVSRLWVLFSLPSPIPRVPPQTGWGVQWGITQPSMIVSAITAYVNQPSLIASAHHR
jgi:hypothetical protein